MKFLGGGLWRNSAIFRDSMFICAGPRSGPTARGEGAGRGGGACAPGLSAGVGGRAAGPSGAGPAPARAPPL